MMFNIPSISDCFIAKLSVKMLLVDHSITTMLVVVCSKILGENND